MQALCERSKECEYFRCEHTDHLKATYVAKKHGQPEQAITWTIEDAIRAKLVDRGGKGESNWDKYPAQMLRARAKADLARMLFAGTIKGLGELSTREELVDVRDATPARLPEVATEVVQKAAAPRDYAKEADALIVRVNATKTKEDRVKIRKAVADWDGISPHKERVLSAYNEVVNAAKKATEPAPPAASAPAAAPAAAKQEIDPETGEHVPPAKAEGRQPGDDG